jgi:hypothetical protein
MTEPTIIAGRIASKDTYDRGSGKFRTLRIDPSTHAMVTTGYAHHEIHGGSSFTAHWDNTTTSDDDHRTLIGFKTPNTTKWAHLIANVSASSPAEFFITEAPTIDLSEGNEISIFNRHRNSTKTSTMLSLETAPVAGEVTTMLEGELDTAQYSGGTIIEHIVLSGGEGPKAAGGSSRGSEELILKQNTIYTFIMQNIGASANLHHINLDWYEHTDKN